MAPRKKNQPKRTGRALGVGDLVSKLIDPALKKRGFASRDILENWRIIAPPPYNTVTIPDRLKWQRGENGAQGALLFLRCHEGHRLALAHDHTRISDAINRYFGYILVEAIKLSPEPFSPRSDEKLQIKPKSSERQKKKVDDALLLVKDDELKQALHKLGLGVLNSKEIKNPSE